MRPRYKWSIILANDAKAKSVFELANIVFAYLFRPIISSPQCVNPYVEWETKNGDWDPKQTYFDVVYVVIEEERSKYELSIPAPFLVPSWAIAGLMRAYQTQIQAAHDLIERHGAKDPNIILRGRLEPRYPVTQPEPATPVEIEELWERFAELIDPREAREAVHDVFSDKDGRGNELAPRLERILCERFGLENPPVAPVTMKSFVLSLRREAGTNRWEELGIVEAPDLEAAADQLGRGITDPLCAHTALLTGGPPDPGEYSLQELPVLTEIPEDVEG